MVSSGDIQSKQNDEKLLKIQYAARENYNFAEELNHFVWLLCLVSAFSVFLPSSCPTIATYGIPFVADIVALILFLLVNRRVTTAAKLRKYFDAYVLNICPNQFSEAELREVKEIAEKAYSKNPQKAIIQMTNTGKDSPPGVHEWYVFPEPCIGTTAQFECQRQNTWWNAKMFHRRFAASICAFILVAAGFLLLLNNNNIVSVILCSAGLTTKIIERLIENWQYISISKEIAGSQKTVERQPTIVGVEELQSLIDKRRAINVLELNWFHKKNANRFSKLYEDSVT